MFDYEQADINALNQVAADVEISYFTWQHLRVKGYVEDVIENTPEGVYGTLTDLGRRVLAQGTAKAEGVGASGGEAFRLVNDSLAAEHVADVKLNYQLQAEVARLRRALETIRAYPAVEEDMDIRHQIAGMVLQAEVALDEVPPRGGLLTILADKLTVVQSELATVRSALAKAEQERDILRVAYGEIYKEAMAATEQLNQSFTDRQYMYNVLDELTKRHMWRELYSFRTLLVELYGSKDIEAAVPTTGSDSEVTE